VVVVVDDPSQSVHSKFHSIVRTGSGKCWMGGVSGCNKMIFVVPMLGWGVDADTDDDDDDDDDDTDDDDDIDGSYGRTTLKRTCK
jgi:hypothetical protein